jgi:hypothetical protein
MKEKDMQQQTQENRLAYQGDMGDGSSVYHMILAGRPVFEVRVDKAEKDIPLYIRAMGSTMAALEWQKTSCRAFTVEDGSRISADSMKEAVYGNLAFLLADLLVGPAQK